MAPLRQMGRALVGALSGEAAPAPAADEPRFAEEFVTFVEKEFSRRQRERLPEELEWRENISYIEGDQHLQINPVTQSLDEVPLLYDWEERECFNQILPIIETRISRLTRGRPIRKVRPASGEQRDLATAQVSSSLLRWVEQETGQRAQTGEVVAWLEYVGTAYKKTVWQMQKGRVVAMQPAAGPDGQPAGEPTQIREGDLEPSVVPATEIYPDNLYATWENNQSIIHARAYHVDKIFEQYGIMVNPEPVEALTLQPTLLGQRGLGYGQGGYRSGVVKLEKHAVVKEFWERPSGKRPNGRLIVVAGRTLLFAGDLPYESGRDGTPDLPFVPYYCLTRPGRFFGSCLVPRLKPLQRRYNRLRNREAEYLKRAAIGQLVIEEGSLVNMEEIELNGTAPGQIFVRKRGFADPQYLVMPPLPPALELEKQTLLTEMRTLSGISDLAKMSQADPGIKSGIALSISLEQDDTRLSTTAGYIEEGLIGEGRLWLRLYKQFATIPRMARIASGAQVDVMVWSASDIRSDDVVIEAGTGLAESPAQRRQFIFDLLGSGLLNDPETGRISREGRAKILELIEFGHWESASDTDYDLQRQKGQRNIKLLQSGRPVQVAQWDDCMVQLQELTRWLLTPEFEESPPPVQQLALQLREQYLMVLQAQAAQQVQQQAEQQRLMTQARTPPPAGGPAGPVPQTAPPESTGPYQ